MGKIEIEMRIEKLLDFLFDRWKIDEILEYLIKEDVVDWINEQKEYKKKLCFKIS